MLDQGGMRMRLDLLQSLGFVDSSQQGRATRRDGGVLKRAQKLFL